MGLRACPALQVSLPLVDAFVVEEFAIQRVVGARGALLLNGVTHKDNRVHRVSQHELYLRHEPLRSLHKILMSVPIYFIFIAFVLINPIYYILINILIHLISLVAISFIFFHNQGHV